MDDLPSDMPANAYGAPEVTLPRRLLRRAPEIRLIKGAALAISEVPSFLHGRAVGHPIQANRVSTSGLSRGGRRREPVRAVRIAQSLRWHLRDPGYLTMRPGAAFRRG
jgi:hypothetical protein